MENQNQMQAAKPNEVVAVLNQAQPTQIAQLDFVKQKFVDNYNLSHPGSMGEMVYHRQMIAFTQAIQASQDLQKADKFSLYACFVTAGVKGYSLDAADGECYLIPRGGKAYLQVQAPAHVRRLQQSGQVLSFDQPKIVYEGDDFVVENGRVVKHGEKFASEKYIAAYVRVLLPNGSDMYFIYRRSDWEAWRSKSPQANGPNWNTNGQPLAAFLRTKVILHAAKEKCWGSGSAPIGEMYQVEIEPDDEPKPSTPELAAAPSPAAAAAVAAMTSAGESASVTVIDNHEDSPF